MFKFTFENIKKEYQLALETGYTFYTCEEYSLNKNNLPSKVIVNRIDIDISVKKARDLGVIYNKLGIKGTFFIRLHAKEYNPFDFENYRVIKFLIESGHEIGYHSEVIDQSIIWDENSKDCLLRDINVINSMFNYKIKGIASHGGMTGFNNLDFWNGEKAENFGLLYEAYDQEPNFDLFNNSFYISDSEWTQWKCYKNGVREQNDNRSLSEHLSHGHPLIYLLIHSDTYFNHNFYE
jgi:hypothetical protein